MANRPPELVAREERGALPLLFPDRAALNAEIAAVLSSKPRMQAAPLCLEPCSRRASAVIGAPAETFEGAQEFIHAAADWVDRGAKASEAIKEGSSAVAEFFKNQMEYIERRSQKQMAEAFRTAGGKYTAAFAKQAVEIKRNALLAVEAINVPMEWFGFGSDQTSSPLRDLERQKKRLARTLEYSATKQAKDLQRVAKNVIELPAGSTLIGTWAKRFNYLTIAIDVGPAFFKVVAAKDEKEFRSASTSFAAEAANAAVSYYVGEAALACVLLLGPAGWVTVGVGLAVATGVGVFAGKQVKKMIDPEAD